MGAGVGRRRVLVGAVVGTALAASIGPAFATVYQTPGREVAIGTEGEDVWAYHVAAANGGRAEAHQGVAASAAGNAWGYFTASGTGCAYSSWLLGVSVAGCASSLLVAASVLGPVVSHPISNGQPFYGASGTGCVETFSLAVSGTGCTESGVAVSGTGNARSHSTWYPGTGTWAPGVAASGTGTATGGAVTASGGSAASEPHTVWVAGTPVSGVGAAVAAGDANGGGGLAAVSATGNADDAFLKVAPFGDAE